MPLTGPLLDDLLKARTNAPPQITDVVDPILEKLLGGLLAARPAAARWRGCSEDLQQRLLQRPRRKRPRDDEIGQDRRKSENRRSRGTSPRGRAAGAAEILEGTTASVPPAGRPQAPHQEFIQIDTTSAVHLRWRVRAALRDHRAAVGSNAIGFNSVLRVGPKTSPRTRSPT